MFYLRLFFVVWFFIPWDANSQQQSTGENHLNYCIDEQALDERRKEFILKGSVNALKFRSSVIERRAIAIDVSGRSEPIMDRYSLPMTLRSLKSKSYLENEKLVLVGDGFDDESLTNTAYELEIEGFRDVKVLENGRRSSFLSSSNKGKGAPSSLQDGEHLHFVSATRALSTAAISNYVDEYHFLIWGYDIPQLKDYGINYSAIVDGDRRTGIKQLEIETSNALTLNKRSKLVLVLADSENINYVRGNDLLRKARNLWVLEGGVGALASAIENTKIKPLKLRNHKFACRTR